MRNSLSPHEYAVFPSLSFYKQASVNPLQLKVPRCKRAAANGVVQGPCGMMKERALIGFREEIRCRSEAGEQSDPRQPPI